MYLEIIENVTLDEFDYDLPKERIAQFPNENRDQSRLLVYSQSGIKVDRFDSIVGLLPENAFVVVNSTKVIEARLRMKKPSGGEVEVLCIEPIEPSRDPQLSLSSKGTTIWQCIIGGRNVFEGMTLTSMINNVEFKANVLKRYENQAEIEFSYDRELTFSDILNQYGKMPLPPYIKRDTTDSDLERYQTVYSHHAGSVAAPTAGLHFTDKVLSSMKDRNIQFGELILHVGPGTFKPIESSIASHNMHKEQFFVEKDLLDRLILHSKAGKPIVATGTTSLRTLESLYWIGLKLYYNIGDVKPQSILLDQFEPYKLSENYEIIPLFASYQAIVDFLVKYKMSVFTGDTKLFILPHYKVQTSQALITNFHLPKSTLLLLVASFIGKENLHKVYDFALQSDFNFLSYGDSSLLFRDDL